MKKIIVFVLLFISVYSFGDTADNYQDLLKKVDSLVNFSDSDISAEYTVTKKDPAGSSSTTVAAMFRRDSDEKFLILILEPVIDKGKGYLKTGDNLWLYDPVGRTFTFTSAKERFQNSSARNSDFNRSNYSSDYEVISGKPGKLGRFDCTVLELNAVKESASFPKIKIWVSDDNLVRKIEDYSLSGQLMRTTAVPKYQKVGEKWLPAVMVILDHLKYRTVDGKKKFERTTIKIKNPSVKKIPDSVYTKEYLEKVNR